jgi:hypothetical protein
MPVSELLSARAFSQLYLDLASECFNRAMNAEQGAGAETLRRMGRSYVAEAAALWNERARGVHRR